MDRTSKVFGRGVMPLPRTALILGMLVLPLAACGDILDVEDPDVTREEFFTDESSVPALQAAAIGDFRDGYEGQILYSGLLGDEWVHSGTFPTRQQVDRRTIFENNATTQVIFRSLQRARRTGESVAERLEGIAPGSRQQAEALNLAGFSLVMIGENYCSGVPLSRRTAEGRFEFGGPVRTNQVFDTAISRFSRALSIATTARNAQQVNLARVGRGRALLNQGRFQEAAAAVQGVPTSFVYVVQHSANSAGENNNIWSFNINQERWSVADREGGNGLAYRTTQDPRMLWARTPANDVGFDRRTPQFDALKYPDRPAFTPVAGGVEARLIEAEAALQRNDTQRFITILNGLRANVGDLMNDRNFEYPAQLRQVGFTAELAPLTLPATRAAQVDLLFQERAYWMWLTSHRLGDMRRLLRQYGRNQSQVFPTGNYAPNGNNKGGVYGTDVNLPIPVDEKNNPNSVQCIPEERNR